MRLILALHRSLALVVGVLLTVWCLTGVVMMYAPYPKLTQEERRAGLVPLELSRCCRVDALNIAGQAKVTRFSLTMSAATPVLRLTTDLGGVQAFDLTNGQALGPAGAKHAAAIAAEFLGRRGARRAAHPPLLVDQDEWTANLEGGPFWRVSFDGGAQVYVRQSTGEVVQESTRAERLWNRVGAIPHWQSLIALRRSESLRMGAVVITAAVGVFLIGGGAGAAFLRLRRREPSADAVVDGWLGAAGLVFGVAALSFAISGLMMLKPPSAPASAVDGARLLAGSPPTWDRVAPMLAAAPKLGLPPLAVEISSAPFAGGAFMSVRSPGQSMRYDARGELFGPDIMQLSALLSDKRGPGLSSLISLTREDGYYFGRHTAIRLPVWRAVLRDSDRTRLYIDQTTGTVLRQVRGDDRIRRWWVEGPHLIDFAVGLRRRPFWDVIVLLLVAGVAIVGALGAWRGLKAREQGQ
jgi:hypothetical protein